MLVSLLCSSWINALEMDFFWSNSVTPKQPGVSLTASLSLGTPCTNRRILMTCRW